LHKNEDFEDQTEKPL